MNPKEQYSVEDVIAKTREFEKDGKIAAGVCLVDISGHLHSTKLGDVLFVDEVERDGEEAQTMGLPPMECYKASSVMSIPYYYNADQFRPATDEEIKAFFA